ncbi:helix-turn-helix domain-containing protein [Spirosoma humi]
MKSDATTQPLIFDSIDDLMQRLNLPRPLHPLIALLDYKKVKPDLTQAGSRFLLTFYKLSFKTSFSGQVKYGPGYYDFKEGGMAFLNPHQLVELSGEDEEYQGYALFFHPDLIRNYPLAQTIHQYGFFSYTVSEALFLSAKEKKVMASLFKAIASELANRIDSFSQDVLVSQIELLLNHSNRFYNRQFLTRKVAHTDLIDRMNTYLLDRYDTKKAVIAGLPSPQEVAAHLNVSQRYLSDMLKSLTGKTTQQHIHLQLIDKAKELLTQSTLSTAQIAYSLGFEHPQSFNKLFKQKTRLSPTTFRQLLHQQ